MWKCMMNKTLVKKGNNGIDIKGFDKDRNIKHPNNLIKFQKH